MTVGTGVAVAEDTGVGVFSTTAGEVEDGMGDRRLCRGVHAVIIKIRNARKIWRDIDLMASVKYLN